MIFTTSEGETQTRDQSSRTSTTLPRNSDRSMPGRYRLPAIWLRVNSSNLALILLAAAPALVANYFVTLDHFFVRGPYLRDAAWFAASMRDWGHNPVVLGGGTIFSTHVFAIFFLTSLLAYAFSLSAVTIFALFHAASYGVLSAALAWWGLQVSGRRILARLATVAVSAMFAFNGLNISMIVYPHVEEMAPGLMLAGLIAMALERYCTAGAIMLLACLVREDVGLHLASFLLVLAALRRFAPPKRWHREMLQLAALCIAYSACAIAVHALFLPQDSAFARVYLGQPPFAHVTASLLAQRLIVFFTCRYELWLPAVLALLLALLERNPVIMAGWIATAPWLALNLGAKDEFAGHLLGYYSYPFEVALCWPLVGISFKQGRFKPAQTNPWEVLGLALVLFTATTSAMLAAGDTTGPIWGAMIPRTSVVDAERAYARAGTLLSADTDGLGRIMVDQCVAGLYPDDFQPAALVGDTAAPGVETVIRFAACRRSDRALGQARAAQLDGAWQRFRGTRVLIISKHALPSLWQTDLEPAAEP